jgi:hypothetical protein
MIVIEREEKIRVVKAVYLRVCCRDATPIMHELPELSISL